MNKQKMTTNVGKKFEVKMNSQRKHVETYQRTILEISVEFENDSMKDTFSNSRQLLTRQKGTPNTFEQIYHDLMTQQIRVSKQIESDIASRERELVTFRETSQNAVVSPLLTEALVKKTKKLLENLPQIPSRKNAKKFRRLAQIIRLLCAIFRNWKRYDVDLLLKIRKLQGEKQQLLPQLGRAKKSTLSITFDTRNFAIFQSKISDDLKDCLLKRPSQRNYIDQRKIASVLSKYKVFQMFSEEKQSIVAKLVGYERYEAGRVVCLQSRFCDRFYFVLSGLISKVKTMYLAEGVKKRYLNELHQGSYTDLYETLRKEERGYSLICKTEVEVFLLEREDLQSLFYNAENESSIRRLFGSIDLFQTYPLDQLFNDGAMKIRFYAKHSMIETGIHESPHIFIVKTGSCNVYMKKSEIIKATKSNRKLLSETREMNRQFGRALNHLPCVSIKGDQGTEDYLFVKTLERSDIFGMVSLLPRVQKLIRAVSTDTQSQISNTTENTVLVSNGVECLLINKNKFLKHSDFFTLSKLMSFENVFPPSLKKLYQALRWSTFKEDMIRKLNEEY